MIALLKARFNWIAYLLPLFPFFSLSANTDVETPPPVIESLEKTTATYQDAFVKMMMMLLLIIAFVFVTFWIVRRLSQGKWRFSSDSSIKILERRPLSPKSMLYLVEVDGKRIVVAESQIEVRAVATLEGTPVDHDLND